MKDKTYSPKKLSRLCLEVLDKAGVRNDVAKEVADCLLQTSLRGIDSHGVRLLPHYVRSVKGGRINPRPTYKFTQTSPSTAILDADHTFGHAAASAGVKKAIEMAREAGSGFVSVIHSSHFSACAYYSLQAAQNNMIGLATTNTSPMMVPTRAKVTALGTNPISFAFPCEGEEPVCIDMATTQVTWNYVQSAKQEGRTIEPNLALDKEMRTIQDPTAAVGLLPMGFHKGYCFAFLVDVLCSILGDAPFGPGIQEMFTPTLSERRHLAHFVGAIDVSRFVGAERFRQQIAKLVETLRRLPPVDPELPVLVPGDPEKIMMKRRLAGGIPLPKEVVEDLLQVAKEYNADAEFLL